MNNPMASSGVQPIPAKIACRFSFKVFQRRCVVDWDYSISDANNKNTLAGQGCFLVKEDKTIVLSL